jgi:GR25 family glycosyltransferase involved in LPS biosynthesis
MIPVFVISLGRAPDRRDAIRARLDALGVPFVLFEAVDGHAMTEEEASRLAPRRNLPMRRKPLSRTEVAIMASHLGVLRRVADEGLPFACVLEDDAVPDASFPAFLDPAWLASIGAFDLLKLSSTGLVGSDMRTLRIGSHAGRTLCAPLHPLYGGAAYIVSVTGARRNLARTRFVVDSADVFLFRHPRLDARILELRPCPVVQSGAPRLQIRAVSTAWWRLLSWLPSRLALLEYKPRRYLVFIRAHGLRALRKLENIPLLKDSDQR